ncbi:MAG TPA: hypothetical protein V6D48_25355, partial [Oculatellaceae cyanobacterium]
ALFAALALLVSVGVSLGSAQEVPKKRSPFRSYRRQLHSAAVPVCRGYYLQPTSKRQHFSTK